jgi:acetyl-CoA decarbonylase/synthase complex subunit gamma
VSGAACRPGGGRPAYVVGEVKSGGTAIPRVATELSRADRLGALAVRLCIGRHRYRVAPGLYAVGHPTPESPVLVTANYKLSFDALRRELGGVDAWLLVLETFGINVWCAAGKGTFGTEELVRRIGETDLARRVDHRRLVLPQLGAPGVAAHAVTEATGFRPAYGPVRAADLPAYLAAGETTDPAMRRVRFALRDRLAVAPVELVQWGPWALGLALLVGLLGLLGAGGPGAGLRLAGVVLSGYLGGGLLVPALLPWLPGRAFAIKGAAVGLALWGVWRLAGGLPAGALPATAAGLLAAASASFVGMNFTGASTFTSVSGVRREMRLAVPLQALAAGAGLLCWAAAQFG